MGRIDVVSAPSRRLIMAELPILGDNGYVAFEAARRRRVWAVVCTGPRAEDLRQVLSKNLEEAVDRAIG
jgi:hypothetical protein